MNDKQSWLCVGGPLAGQFHNPGRQNFAMPIYKDGSALAPVTEGAIDEKATVQYAEYHRQRFQVGDGRLISFWVPVYQTPAQTIELLLASYELAEANARTKKK